MFISPHLFQKNKHLYKITNKKIYIYVSFIKFYYKIRRFRLCRPNIFLIFNANDASTSTNKNKLTNMYFLNNNHSSNILSEKAQN